MTEQNMPLQTTQHTITLQDILSDVEYRKVSCTCGKATTVPFGNNAYEWIMQHKIEVLLNHSVINFTETILPAISK